MLGDSLCEIVRIRFHPRGEVEGSRADIAEVLAFVICGAVQGHVFLFVEFLTDGILRRDEPGLVIDGGLEPGLAGSAGANAFLLNQLDLLVCFPEVNPGFAAHSGSTAENEREVAGRKRGPARDWILAGEFRQSNHCPSQNTPLRGLANACSLYSLAH